VAKRFFSFRRCPRDVGAFASNYEDDVTVEWVHMLVEAWRSVYPEVGKHVLVDPGLSAFLKFGFRGFEFEPNI
jgi:hypothetical protein